MDISVRLLAFLQSCLLVDTSRIVSLHFMAVFEHELGLAGRERVRVPQRLGACVLYANTQQQ